MAILLTLPTCKHRAPPLGSQCLSFQRLMSTCIRHGGLSLTRVLVYAPIHGPIWALSSSIQISISGQHHNSRGSKTLTYYLWGASCMLPHLPLNTFHHPHSPFHCHLTPLRLARENLSRGEGVATEQRATETRHPEPSKPPDTHGKDLQEAGGVPSVLGNSPAFPEKP